MSEPTLLVEQKFDSGGSYWWIQPRLYARLRQAIESGLRAGDTRIRYSRRSVVTDRDTLSVSVWRDHPSLTEHGNKLSR